MKLKYLLLFLCLAGCTKKVVVKPAILPEPPELELVQEVFVPQPDPLPKIDPVELYAEPDRGPFDDIDNIYFEFDTEALSTPQKMKVETVARALIKHPQFKALLIGAACPIGENEYNLALGLRRSESVQDYLVYLGIPGERIKSISIGEKDLVTEFPEEYWKNRRVMLKAIK